jgi:hypothetical protein
MLSRSMCFLSLSFLFSFTHRLFVLGYRFILFDKYVVICLFFFNSTTRGKILIQFPCVGRTQREEIPNSSRLVTNLNGSVIGTKLLIDFQNQQQKSSNLDEQLKEYIAEWRKQRGKEEDDLKKLKDKQAKRKVQFFPLFWRSIFLLIR